MPLKDVMTREVEIISPEDSIEEAARKMDRFNAGPLPVCDGKRLVGMVTDRDITVRATAAGKDPRAPRVREAMTKDVLYCFDDQDVGEAARLMQTQQVRRLPVLNRSQRLVSIVSLGDLATDIRDDRLSGEVLERVSEPAEPDR